MESRSSSPSPGQSGQDDREEDADSPVAEGNPNMIRMDEEQYGENSNDRDLRRFGHNQGSRFQHLESDSEAVAQRTAEQDSDEDYEIINAHLIHRNRQPESPSAAATSSSTSSAVVAANSGPTRRSRQLHSRRNIQEEPGSSSQLTPGINSVGGSHPFHGAMMLSDEDIDPEIDSAASNNFIARPNDNHFYNFPNVGDSHDYWQASSSSSSNMISTGAFNVEDEIRRLNNDNEHALEEDGERINFDARNSEINRGDIPQMEEDNEIRQRNEPSEIPSNIRNRAVQYSAVSVPHFSPQPSSSAGSSSNRNFWYSASAGPSIAGPSSSSSNVNSNPLTLASTSASGCNDISNSNSRYNPSSGNLISTTSSSITSGSVDNSQDPTTSSGGIPPLYSLAASSSPSSVASSYPLPQHIAMHGYGMLSSSGDVAGSIPPTSDNIFQSSHGEISNPPSPLGGRVNPSENINRRTNEEGSESPEAGTSGIPNIAAKRGLDAAVDFIDLCDASETSKKFRTGSGHSSIADDNSSYQLPDADDVPSLQSPNNEEGEEDNDDSDRAYEQPMYQREFATSEAAAAPRPVSPVNRNPSSSGNEIEDDISDDVPSPSERIRHSPLHVNPQTPADQCQISSSTGQGNDSIPPTPVDLHGDNDLSVPSPYRPNMGVGSRREQSPIVFRGRSSRNRVEEDVDDMIDSTVDSTGIPLADVTHQIQENHLENEANGYGVESSHYEDSSDDENCNMDSSTGSARNCQASNSRRSDSPRQNARRDNNLSRARNVQQPSINIVNDFYGNHSRSWGNSNDGSISTSGQVDDGQFRLVPNQSDNFEIEDDSTNEPFDSIHRYNDVRKDHITGSHNAFDGKEDMESPKNGTRKSDSDSSEAAASASQLDISQQHSPLRPNIKGQKVSATGTGKTTDRRLIKNSSNLGNRPSTSSSSTANIMEIRQRTVRENGDHPASVSSNSASNQLRSHLSNHSENVEINRFNNKNKSTQERQLSLQSSSDLNRHQPSTVLPDGRHLEQIQLHNHPLLVPPHQVIETCDPCNPSHERLSRSKLNNGGTSCIKLNNNSKVSGQSSSTNVDKKEALLLPSVPSTIDISLAFSGIPQSLSSNCEIYQQKQQDPMSHAKDTGMPPAPTGHHSSILESMTGPLSKRLRTLHSLQQQQGTDNEDMDKNQSKTKPQASARSQIVPNQLDPPINGRPVNRGHRESNLLFQHLVRHQDKNEGSNAQSTKKPGLPCKISTSSEAVKVEKEKRVNSEVHQIVIDSPSTSRSSTGERLCPNGEDPAGGTHSRSNGEQSQREHGQQEQGQASFGGTQQTFSVTSIETVGSAATEALRNYSDHKQIYPTVQIRDTNICDTTPEMDITHQFVTPEVFGQRSQLNNNHSEVEQKLSATLERVMDPGISRTGGSGSNWIDPKNELKPTFNRNRRRKTKNMNSGFKVTQSLQNNERIQSSEVKYRHPQSASTVIQIQDRPVLTRAIASLPSNYLSIRPISRNTSMRFNNITLSERNICGEKGVFAKKLIPKSCRFGPLEGREVELSGEEASELSLSSPEDLMFTIVKETQGMIKIDIAQEEHSNWMRFVRTAECLNEQNLVISQEGDQLFYTTTKSIEPKEELKVGYTSTYAKQRGLQLLQVSRNDELDSSRLSNVVANKRYRTTRGHVNRIQDSSEEQPFKPAKLRKENEQLLLSQSSILSSHLSSPHLSSFSGNVGQVVNSSDSKPFNCPICPRSFDRQYSLERHIILHKADKKYECNECDAKYSLAANLTRHQRQVHMVNNTHGSNNEEQQPLKDIPETIPQANKENVNYVSCSDCHLSYEINSGAYKIHRYSHDARADLSEDPVLESKVVQDSMRVFTNDGSYVERTKPNFLCTDCASNFITWEELIEHSGQHGMDVNLTSIKVNFQEGNNDTSSSIAKHIGKPHKCELCYKSFASEERLSKHMAVHGSDDSKPLSCKECGKRFLNNSALACHSKVHAGNGNNPNGVAGYDCPICGTPFEQIHSLKEHVHVHRDITTGTYSCPHCQKTFPEYPMIRKHIRAFHSAKRFQCSECEKAFTGADKLKAHMVKHSDFKEFECNECGKQFKRKDKLKEHAKRMHASSVNNVGHAIPLTYNTGNINPKIDPSGDDGTSNVPASHRSKKKKKLRRLNSDITVQSNQILAQKTAEVSKSEVLPQNTLNNFTERTNSSSVSESQAIPVSPSTKRHVPKVPATDYERFTFKCHLCLLGFKRRGMLVNHLVKRHPEIPLNSVNELNMPILKPSKDYYCQYCNKVYKSSSKRKVHILKNHPGAPLPLSVRQTNNEAFVGTNGQNPTYSATVGSIKLQPHRCKQCHRQYASNAKLLQHQRKKHQTNIPNANGEHTKGGNNIFNEPTQCQSKENKSENQDMLTDEWDLFTSRSNKTVKVASKSSLEINLQNNSQHNQNKTDSSRDHSDQSSSNSHEKNTTYSDDEDDGGVALQYIVHDNGDLEVVQRAMPSASFSDRRSVDTPLPAEEIPSSHPDALECANARQPIIPAENCTFISTNESGSNTQDINRDVLQISGVPQPEGICLDNKSAQLIQLPCNAPNSQSSVANHPQPSMMVASPSTSRCFTTPHVIIQQPNVQAQPRANFQYNGMNHGGSSAQNQAKDFGKCSAESIELVLGDHRNLLIPQSQSLSYQNIPLHHPSEQMPISNGRLQIQAPFYNINHQNSNQDNQKSMANFETTNSSKLHSSLTEPQPQLREHLVTVNADHIAPMTSQYSNNSNSNSSEKISTQGESRTENNSNILSSHYNNTLRTNHSEASTSQDPYEREDDVQTKTERELTEWLNDAYKRKR